MNTDMFPMSFPPSVACQVHVLAIKTNKAGVDVMRHLIAFRGCHNRGIIA